MRGGVEAQYRSILNLCRCEGLDDGDLVGKTDAYAYIEISGCDAQQTKTISGTLNPEWNETCRPVSESQRVDVVAHAVVLQVHVQD